MRALRLTALLSAFFATLSLAVNTKLGLQHFPSLLDADLEDLAAGLKAGLFTSVDLVNAYTARILEVNSTLHVVTELNPDALAIAAEADAHRAVGELLGPLHGIPILIKNNIATADSTTNTAGSWALVGSRVPEDSTMASKLRSAGAVILGRVNLSQWANFRSTNSSNGWSAHGGQTYGAYYPGQDPLGSSSGSGVASALGLALATLGTETSGSILAPADVSNVVGIKPSMGLTSRFLVIPISEHQDTIGPMARTVKDAAYLLQAIAGPDPKDNYTSAIPFGDTLPDYVAACDFNALEGKRIGVPWNVLEIWAEMVDEPVLNAFHESIAVLEEAGATIVDANFTGFADWLSDGQGLSVFYADMMADLANYLAALSENPNDLKTLQDVRDFTHAHPEEEAEERNTELWDNALEQGWDNTDPRFWPIYQKGLTFGDEGGVLGALERSDTDAIILPTHLSPPIPAIVGSPVITVPMGFYPEDWPTYLNSRRDLIASAPDVPFGLSFMGRRWSEAELIGYAYAYEQRTNHRHDVQPYITPNVELEDIVGRQLVEGSVWDNERVCAKAWIEKCESYEEWPRVMREQGAETKRSWWVEMAKEEGQDVEEALVKEAIDET